MKGDIFDAVVWTDPPLIVSRKTPRGPYAVRIADKATRVWLPLRGPREIRERVGRSARRPMPEFPAPQLAGPVRKGLWMESGSSALMPQRPLIIEAFRLRWHDPQRTGDEDGPWRPGQGFDDDVAPWLSLVRDWLAAWRHEERGEVPQQPTPRIRMGRVGGRMVLHGGDNATGGVHLARRPISTPSELRAAFAAASSALELPTEYALYGEALAYAAGGRYREAVISACGAVEVALAGCADALLAKAGRNEDERGELLDRVSGVVDLYRLSATTSEGLPVSLGQVKNRLAGPRNNAAHRGQAPSEETVRLAIETARKMLNISPLPSARSLIRMLGRHA